MQLVIDTEKQTQQPLAEYISKQALENTELHKQIGVYREFVQNLCHDLRLSLQSDLVLVRDYVKRKAAMKEKNVILLRSIWSELGLSVHNPNQALEDTLAAVKRLKSNTAAKTEAIPLLRTLAATLDLPVAGNDTLTQTVSEIIDAVRRIKIVSEQRKNTIEVIGKANRAMREQKLTGVSLARHAEVGQERALLRSQLEQEKLRSAAVERKLADAILLGDEVAAKRKATEEANLELWERLNKVTHERDALMKEVHEPKQQNVCPKGFKVVAKDTLDYARHQPGDSHYKVVPV